MKLSDISSSQTPSSFAGSTDTSPSATPPRPRSVGLEISEVPTEQSRFAEVRRASSRRVSRTDRLTTIWLILAIFAAAGTIAAHDVVPQQRWILIHLVTLGVLSHAIFQWSWYFTRALLHLSPQDHRSNQFVSIRTVSLTVVLGVLIASMWVAFLPGVVVGALAVAGIASWNAWDLLVSLRGSLKSRFGVIVRFYVVASAFFALAAIFASLVAVTIFSASAPAWLLDARDSLTLAHALAGVLGWVGITIGGTLLTLGPTMIRTKMAPYAVQWGVRALPWWAVGVTLACFSVLVEAAVPLCDSCSEVGPRFAMWGFVAGLAVTTVAIGVGIVLPLEYPLRHKGLREYPAATTACGVVASVVALLGATVLAVISHDSTEFRNLAAGWLPLVGAAGPAQIFVGALSYLMPVVIGGGPQAVRSGIAVVEHGAFFRLSIRNAALVAVMLIELTQPLGLQGHPVLAAVHMGCWILVIGSYISDVVMFTFTGIIQGRTKKERHG